MNAFPGTVTARYPLSSVQREIWFEQALYPDAPLYNVGGYNRIDGAIDPALFRQAIAHLVAETDVLRLVLSERDGVPFQSFPEMLAVDVGFRDLSAEADPFGAALAFMQEAIRRPFRLFDEPLFRYTLFRLSDTCHVWSHTYHHLVTDGWASSLITQRVAALYTALLRREAMPAQSGGRYLDFIAGDIAYLNGPSCEQHRQFWRRRFADLPEPLLSPRAGLAAHAEAVPGEALTWHLPRAECDRLEALGRSRSVSLFPVLLALLYTYFVRVRDRDECVIGVPVLNRHTPAFKRTIGLFAGMVPVRLGFGREITFSGLVQAIAAALRESYRAQRLPVSDIKRLADPGGAGRSRLFDLSLSFEKHDYAARFGDAPPCGTTGLINGYEQTPLAVFVRDYAAGRDVQIDFSYNLAYFDAGEIARVRDRFRHLIGGVLASPDTPLRSLDILPPAERRLLLEDWNATARPVPEGCIHERFEAQARHSPEAVAVVCGEEAVSYRELDARANRLAHALIARRIGPDRLVAVALERSVGMIVALLAVLKAGGAYVPLDPDYPPERLAFMLKDSGARVLITEQRLRSRLPDGEAETLCLDAAALAGFPETGPGRLVAPGDLAYVIYTSGSTGTPKGAMNTHGAIFNRLLWMQDAFALRHDDHVLQKTPSSFDVSVWEFFWPLMYGARLVFARPGGHRDNAYLADLIVRERITTIHFVPPMLQAFLDTAEARRCTSLRRVICSGQELPASVLPRFFDVLPGCEIHNLYGPTEAAVDVTWFPCTREDAALGGIPIGRPIANTRLYVLDPHGEPVPVGVAGELYIGGAGLARGYLNRPELTAEKFVPDRFGGAPGGRLYRTGDLVRYRADGNIEFLGRLDLQVKIRGFRIELGEIEAALTAHPGVREAVVAARDDGTGGQRLVAYLVPAGTAPAAEELRRFLKERLPEYMVPAAWVVLDGLPLTPNGKLDRKALPEPEAAAAPVDDAAPRDPLEEIVAGLWADVLQRDAVGIHDDFFELGADSLMATRVASRLREAVAVEVPVRWLFDAPTVAELASRIRSAGSGPETDRPLDPVAPDQPAETLDKAAFERIARTVEGGASNIEDIFPLAPLQEGILYHHRRQPSGDAYLSHALLEFDSPARCDAFLAGLQAAVDRHDILRAAFVWEGLPEPLQVVWRRVALPVETLHLDPAFGPVADQMLAARQPRRTRLDVTRAPLLRLVRADDGGRTLLLFLTHHLIMDHTTLAVLLEEIATHARGKAETLPPAVPFRDFVAMARRSVTAAEHEAFFRDLLGDVDTPTTPFGLVGVNGDGSSLVEARHELPGALALELRREARRLGVTPAALCHLAWALVLARCSGRDDVLFGTVLFGRVSGGERAERALGMFINTLPVRIARDDRAVSVALRETQQLLLRLLRHEHAQLGLAQRCSKVAPPAPLFSALLNYRHTPGAGVLTIGLEGTRVVEAEERSNYPLALSVDDRGDGLTLTAQADPAVDPDRVCALMQQALAAIATALAEAPDTPLQALDILPPAERRLLLEDWNATARPVPDGCIHQRFEAQARHTPKTVAVVCGEEAVSYRELDARANRLAHALIARGIGPDRLVAVALERSVGMIVALLAVLKAGGAYVPLDPDYPPERLAFMLKDSGARVLITEQRLRSRLPDGEVETLCLDAAALDGFPETRPGRRVAPGDLAYVIYTSGSTGTPKGVAVEHRAIVAHCAAVKAHRGPTPEDRVLQFASPSFDVALEQILPTLCHGARLVLLPAGVNAPETVDRIIREQRVTIANVPPGFFAEWIAQTSCASVAGLRMLLVGGDVLSTRLVASWRILPGSDKVRLINAYGPTEATITATVFDVAGPLAGASVPIGRPFGDRTAYILDGDGEPVPVGVAGELYIGGAGLARGYLNRPELTAEKFVPDRFGGAPGGRLYRTGDLVRYRDDGNIEFLGRLDHQVKIRGFRIELGEIEAALTVHPEVREAVVAAREDGAGGQRLVAYLVPAAAAAPAAEELRRFLKERLPEYMVPAAWVVLDGLPLTPNGKLDRKALPEPEAAAAPTDAAAPRDPLEEIVAGLWADVLQRDAVGIHDDFFELGGHSLLALRLIAEIERRLGKRLPIGRLFEFPTISAMSAFLRTQGDLPAASCLIGIRPRGARSPLFFVPGAGGWIGYLHPLVHCLDPEVPFYAFQAEGLDGSSAPHTDIDVMAAHYVDLLQEVQPSGSFRLAGHSFGGQVAFAMAQLLSARGHEVEQVAIIDTPAPDAVLPEAAGPADDGQLLIEVVRLLFDLARRESTLSPQDLDGLDATQRLAAAARHLEGAALCPEGAGADFLRNLTDTYKAHLGMHGRRRPADAPLVPITLFRGEEGFRNQPPALDEALGWRRHSSRPVRLHRVPGNHITMMTPPHVETLARILGSTLT